MWEYSGISNVRAAVCGNIAVSEMLGLQCVGI